VTPERNAAFYRYVLANLRIARARVRLVVDEIDMILTALQKHAISSEDALLALHQAGGMNFLWSPPPPSVNWEELNGEASDGNGMGTNRESPVG
jgi:hypothetical protein